MEKRDLYDLNKKRSGMTILKDEKTPEGYSILVVVAIIQNHQGEFLIQKRSEDKGGKWALTGGHPKAGEDSLQGIQTEVKEELGIEIEDSILFKEASGKNIFCDLYYVKQDVDLDKVTLQEEEVTDVKFASKEEIDQLYKEGLFKEGHYRMFQDYLEYEKKTYE